MFIEIPVLRRCCCCLPLRRGILVFGYLSLGYLSQGRGATIIYPHVNLIARYKHCSNEPLSRSTLDINIVVACLFTTVQSIIWKHFKNTTLEYATTVGLYRGVVIEAQICVIFLLYALDIVFNIVLLIGAHKKSRRLMRVYYYYQLTTMIASFLVMFTTYHDIVNISGWELALSEFSIAFTGFVIQIYLLLLIRSELKKDRYTEGRSSFVNHAAEVLIEPPLRRQWRTALYIV